MTDKEKARHYDESIERARQFYRTPYLEDSASVVSYIFPELKVENDNRIKNELIEFVKSRGGFKQEYIDWLEKQGSEESVDPDTLIQQRVDALVDIAETKFHEGDWVVTDMNNIFQIKAYNNGYYIIGNGTAYNMSYVDRCWHLWSIKDAKDGDILVTDKRQPFIFNGHYDKDTDYIYAYCGISGLVKDNAFYAIEDCADEEFAVWCTIESVCPATKEQCDILFQKMKEAGYEWDADAKQLKKIAQKSTDWSQDDEQYLLVCKNALQKYESTDKWDANIIYNWLKNKLQKHDN